VPWALAEGAAGLLVDVRSASELAAAISRVLGDGQLWSALSERGFRNAWERFRTAGMVEHCLDEYRRIAASDAAREAQPGSR